jgi:NAD(P)-dependent dehydrogenase (short-subunit alcohol dehydrogenase family)
LEGEADECDTASYSASKGAVVNLTRQIGVDYGKDKIHCNAICPGCKSLPSLSPLSLLELEARADDGPE